MHDVFKSVLSRILKKTIFNSGPARRETYYCRHTKKWNHVYMSYRLNPGRTHFCLAPPCLLPQASSEQGIVLISSALIFLENPLYPSKEITS